MFGKHVLLVGIATLLGAGWSLGRAQPVSPTAIQGAYIKASNTEAGDVFGSSVAVSGNTLVVGAHDEASAGAGVNPSSQADNSASRSGAVYVFEKEAGSWVQTAYIKASNSGFGDQFGYSVALDGDTLVVGALREDGNGAGVNPVSQSDDSLMDSGAAYVFRRVNGVWSQEAYIKPSDPGAHGLFGTAVAISGDTFVVGAPGDPNAAPAEGAAYVFRRSNGVWMQQAALRASNANLQDGFGFSVTISGETIAVGAVYESGDGSSEQDNSMQSAGAVYVFERVGAAWTQEAYLKASNAGAQDLFGYSVALSNDVLAVGSIFEDGNGVGVDPNAQDDNSLASSGAAYVFARAFGVWTQQSYIKASNPNAGDFFGNRVAVLGDTLLVGALTEDSVGAGINSGLQADNSLTSAGAVYLLERRGNVWGQQAYIKPSNPGGDQFSYGMAITADTFAITSFFEAGNGVGVNPDAQDDNSLPGAGAAYAFQRLRQSRLAVFVQGQWFIDRNGDGAFDPGEELGWGSAGDIPVKGDWNGDGFDDLGVFSNGTWFVDLDADRAFDPAKEIKGWGVAGWIPVTGDWNGDGKTDLGAINPATMEWFLDRNGDMQFDSATEVLPWGLPGETPVVGDWDGDGRDEMGIFSGGFWLLDVNGDGAFDAVAETKEWGAPGHVSIVGDWNGDGIDDLGAIDPATMTWFLDLDGDGAFNPATEIVGWGSPGETPVAGDWDGDGDDDIGVYSGGLWIIDANGDRQFQPATEAVGWGAPGWTPLTGARN